MLITTFIAGTLMAAGATSISQNERMGWWRDSRFGLFIHWGLYSVPAGHYKDKTGEGEWLMETSHVPVEEYEKYATQFNPTKFDPDAWAKIAKDAGMKYVVITTKHHDGFALFDSKVSDYTITHTPYKKDIMAMLSKSVRKQGLHMGWYHSIMDWHNPNYIPARAWNDRQGGQKNLDKYVPYLYAQVKELLTNYGKIDVMWFDGEWESTWQEKYAKKLFAVCRACQPSIVVNNRVGNSRGGSMESLSGGLGDYLTPEQSIPDHNPGMDWETCMTMNDHWGWNQSDKEWKSTKTIVQNLVDVVSKGGNYLLNVGPRADGTFPDQAISTLHEVGGWMKVNGEAIYGTTASPFDAVPWGRYTVKRGAKTSAIYLHVFQNPASGEIVVPGMGNKVISAKILGGSKLIFSKIGQQTKVDLPSDEHALPVVVKLTVSGTPIVFRKPVLSSNSNQFINSILVKTEPAVKGSIIRYTTDGTDPSPSSPVLSSQVRISESKTVRAALFHKGVCVSDVTSLTVAKVVPMAASTVSSPAPGFKWAEYEGKWEKCPNWSTLAPVKTGVGNLGMVEDHAPVRENYGRVFRGFILMPADEVYVFKLTSDDGSKLTIDGVVVVDNDGLHTSSAKTGSIALTQGRHAIQVEWFNGTGWADLRLDWARAGLKFNLLKPSDICHENK